MYQTPYAFPNLYPTQMATNQVIKVHGRNGADLYSMLPNSSVLLLDELEPIVYLAQTDGAGYKTVTAYDISVHEDIPPVDVKSLEQRIAKLEEALHNEPNTSNNKQWQSRTGKADGSNVQGYKQSNGNGKSVSE